ncbi:MULTISPECIES: SAV_6107 family HEPN domain-containing protein [unclassified Frankia]
MTSRPISGSISGSDPAGGAARSKGAFGGHGGSTGPRGASTEPVGRTLVSAAGLPRRSRDDLLVAARRGLGEAEYAQTTGDRYALAHLAALRAAAAVLADRARPRPGRRGRPVSAWCLLVRVAPELAEWAEFFAAGAARRSAAEAGLKVVTRREADDLIHQVDLFIGVVEGVLGLPSQPVIAGTGPVGRGEVAMVTPPSRPRSACPRPGDAPGG